MTGMDRELAMHVISDRLACYDAVFEWALNADPPADDLTAGWLAAQEVVLSMLRTSPVTDTEVT